MGYIPVEVLNLVISGLPSILNELYQGICNEEF